MKTLKVQKKIYQTLKKRFIEQKKRFLIEVDAFDRLYSNEITALECDEGSITFDLEIWYHIYEEVEVDWRQVIVEELKISNIQIFDEGEAVEMTKNEELELENEIKKRIDVC